MTIASNSALPHNSRRKRVVRRPSDRLKMRVGEFYATAAQVRAEIDRVDARYLSLKRDIATHFPLTDEFRQAFNDLFGRWYTFSRDARADWLAWGSNVSQAQYFDNELDRFRAQYTERTGAQPTNPTTSQTAQRPSFPSGRTIALVAGAVGVAALAIAFASREVSS